MSKGGGNTRQVMASTVEPPEYQKPFLEYGLSEAKQLYESGLPEYYPGQTTVGFSPESELALSGIRERALGGSPLVTGAQSLTGQAMAGQLQNLAMPYAQGLAGGVSLSEPIGMVRQTARGDFLSGSPGLTSAIERALDPVEERLQAQQSMAGRYGSAYGQRAAADAMSRVAGDIAYQDYARERSNQLAAQQNLAQLEEAQYGSQLRGMGALGQLSTEDIGRRLSAAAAAPQMAALDYADLQTLSGVGAAREAQQQAELGADIQRYQFEQARPQEKLAQYLAATRGGDYGSSTYEPRYSQPAASFLGGAMQGAQLAGMIPGLSGGMGAVGGGLLSLLG